MTSKHTSHRPTAFGTGLVGLDLVFDRGPVAAPVPSAGGTCANVLAILSYLGWESFPIARLADDLASVYVRDDLKRWGVALDFVAQVPAAPTPVITQTIQRARNEPPRHRFSFVCPACGARFPRFRSITRPAAGRVLRTLAVSRTSEFAPSVFFLDRLSPGAIHLASAFAARGTLVVFEPSGMEDRTLFAQALSVGHVLKYSRSQLPRLSALPPASPSWLLEIETCGAAGLRFRSRHGGPPKWQELDAVGTAELVDTAGAGDWCSAGLLAELATAGVSSLAQATALDLARAIRVGQAAAAVACEYAGARGAMYHLSRSAFRQAVADRLAVACEGAPTRQIGGPARARYNALPKRPAVCLHGYPWGSQC